MRRLLLIALCACAHSEHIQTNSAETVRTTETREEGPETITTTVEEYGPPQETEAEASAGRMPDVQAVEGRAAEAVEGKGRGASGQRAQEAATGRLLKRTVTVDQRSPASTVTTTADDTTVKTDSKTETRVGPGFRFYLFLLLGLGLAALLLPWVLKRVLP